MLNTYRLRQFWQAVTAKPGNQDLELAHEYLSPPLMALFTQMQKSEQMHSISVFQDLLSHGEENPDLLIAALLHDVGKIKHPLSLFERIEIVIGTALFPKQSKKWGKSQPQGWKRPFVIAQNHPQWGAETVKNAGASKQTVEIIRRHHETITQENTKKTDNTLEILIRKLQEFDNQR